jgi:hypothetical protein
MILDFSKQEIVLVKKALRWFYYACDVKATKVLLTEIEKAESEAEAKSDQAELRFP